MNVMMVTMGIDPARPAELNEHLHSDVIPYATSQPGFVRGQWLLAADAGKAFGVVVFSSAQEADAAAAAPRAMAQAHDPDRAWNVERVDVLDLVAEA